MTGGSGSPIDVSARRRNGQRLLAAAREGDQAAPRVAVLSSFNVDFLPPLLAEALDRAGLPAPLVNLGEFGQISQEALNPSSPALPPGTDAVVVIPALEDLLAALYDPAASLSSQDAAQLVEDRLTELATALSAVLERLPAAIVHVVVMGSARAPVEHVLDPASTRRGQWAVERWLARVRELGSLSPRITLVDWDWHTRRDGTRGYEDARLWYLARMRLSPLGLAILADLLATHMSAQGGQTRKVIAVDLDDTLWGGIVGEDGLTGVVCGHEGQGLAFQDFQRELLALRDTGVVLVIASKNNPEDAHEVLERHPDMVLRPEHFATERINWEDKASNLVAMAQELDLGIDSFVLLDDNPVERDFVRRALPEVAVPELPADPVLRPAFLRELPLFRRLSLTAADRERPGSYRAHVARKQTRTVGLSLADYIASLEQTIAVEPVDSGSLARAAQLCQRTNQFNLTTRRYSVAELELLLSDENAELFTVAVSDRFGDSGITGLVILRFATAQSAAIDTLLLSCRVLGRGIEQTLLEFAAARARARGRRSLQGAYVPTAKNGQVAEFYPRAGFTATDKEQGVFALDLSASELGLGAHSEAAHA
jgi:FkbH-like protein